MSTWNCSAAQGYIPSGQNRRYVHTSKYMYVSYRDKYRIVSNCWFDLRGGGAWRWSQTLIFFSDMLPCMQGGWWDTVDDKRKFEIKVCILLSRNFQRRGRKIFCMENNYECMGDLIF